MARTSELTASLDDAPDQAAQRTLVIAGINHALHDGYTDLIYVLLPVWQAEFGLDYVALALLRSLYNGALAALQMPASRLAQALGARTVLILGTLLSAGGYALAGASGDLLGLGAGLLIGGAGSSTQHPLASAVIARAYGPAARGPLGTYNFAGDLGKAAVPPLVGVLLTLSGWRTALWVIAGAGVVVALAVARLLPRDPDSRDSRGPPPPAPAAPRRARGQSGAPRAAPTGVPASGCWSPSACSTTPRGRPSCSICRS
jgi:FSR family fosmidomycin resistance protein-like MFS transporter